MNLIQLQRINCIHKHVCFHNGIRCGEFICRDIQPKTEERICKNLATRKDDFFCSECECEVVGCMVDDFGCFDNPLCFSYCPNCGAKVVGDPYEH